jgi:hypothetical protein
LHADGGALRHNTALQPARLSSGTPRPTPAYRQAADAEEW